MGFPIIRREIMERIKRRLKHSKGARERVRKSGFRPGIEGEGGPSAGGSGQVVLSIPPVTPVGGCPRPPFNDTDFSSHADRLGFYADAKAAQSGESGSLDIIRDMWLIDYFGMQHEIVMDCVMPLLGYEYDDEVCTLTFLEDNGCRVEIDVAPPDNGLWEHYQTGISEARFLDGAQFFPDAEDQYVNIKFLTERIRLRTRGAFQAERKSASTGELYEADIGDATNTQSTTGDIFRGYRVWGYIANYDEDGVLTSGVLPLAFPRINLSTDEQMEHPMRQFTPGPGVDSSDNRGQIAGAVSLSQWPNTDTSEYGDWGYYNFLPHNPYQESHRFYEEWRATGAPGTIDYTHSVYPVMASDQESLEADPATRTFREQVVKEAPQFAQGVDFTVNPTSNNPGEVGYEVTRYDHSFELFDVVAVRVIGGGPSQPV